MNRKLTAAALAALTAGGLVTAIALTPAATAGQSTPAAAADTANADMLAALGRDLKLSPDQARQRLDREHKAARTESALRGTLGNTFGGAWLDQGANTLTVALTDPAKADQVRALGAVPKTVGRSQAQLDALKGKLDSTSVKAPKSVPGWYVDVNTNAVVVLTKPGKQDAAKAWAAASGVDASAVRYENSSEEPRPLIDVIGGNAYNFGGGSRCSIGFSVNGGFVTAGHCGTTGTQTSNPSGSVGGSSFPGNDYGWVRVAAGNTPRALVNRYPGTVPVAGSTEAAVGASVCRSGSTTGWHCGTIQQKNASVTYQEGTVSGLTRTNACAEPGDSGGSWLAGDQAQGVTSGGSGNCTSGGTFYFQPVNEILQAFGLQLLTSGTTPPTSTTRPTNPTTTTTGNPGNTTWAANTNYATGATVTYAGVSYRCLQGHYSLTGWEPPNVPSLWQRS
ncbi:alpha-lytic protease prodomain-containing protein [Actinokineospora sp. NBRC 105648]|uniref:alpha-lytic protease prodomain-containing protein n=1 Tax=Actinokineospora sp. NBRC 105648 TaxID=3032206 RepID=UPI0024A32E50|nr:alpha-lytic protease prodomain-containing protein [Actinokineospora sp. NBRC 105648]GLZ37734.1 serine protease [Actinokineospora sp. NBRC 105648]